MGALQGTPGAREVLMHHLHSSNGCCMPLQVEKKTIDKSFFFPSVEKAVETSFTAALGSGSNIKEVLLSGDTGQ